MDYNTFYNFIKESKNILIVSHVNPDGDTLGSMCALRNVIKSEFKKNADMLVLGRIPKNYEFIPSISLAKHVDEYDKSLVYDLVVAVDVAAVDRMVNAKILFDKAKHTVNIDHHKTNNNYAEMNFVKPNASSAGEVLFNILKLMNLKIDIETATSLYTAILTDTGGFRFENTSAKVFEMVSELVELGANPAQIYKNCYESKTKNLVMFQNYCLNKAVFCDNDTIAYTTVYKKDLEKFSGKDDFTEGIAEALRAIISTQVAFVVKEVESRSCKVSMRSKSIDVSAICEVFGGGGHKFAAGCTIKSNVEDSIAKLLNEIRKINEKD